MAPAQWHTMVLILTSTPPHNQGRTSQAQYEITTQQSCVRACVRACTHTTRTLVAQNSSDSHLPAPANKKSTALAVGPQNAMRGKYCHC